MQENQEKKDILDEDSSEDEVGSRVYELGFLVVPSTLEEKLPEIISSIKSEMEKIGSVFISEEYPRLQNLSYTMFRSTDQKKQAFNQAYFGWIKFETGASNISELKKSFEENPDILRFLLIKTVKENTLYSYKLAFKKGKIVKKSPPDKFEEKSSIEEIDKSIDKLVAKS